MAESGLGQFQASDQAAQVCGECGQDKPAQPPEYWTPSTGDEVWINYPDAKGSEGVVVGFVPEGERRAGQPIIERQRDEPAAGLMQIGGKKKGDQVVIHPMFLLPFPYGGKEWRRAYDEGRVS